ncbi:threonine/serine ThrE exporter family protein [Veillonella agrestimuris]|uniref:threonine/serine ThrE exporter family protein n=1 Tax=Veillonella agrestimuris TaxID=2941340 RepID=UPI00203EF387|nr:threonine/serine exporter family protein [Veillonella agrestimuris]
MSELKTVLKAGQILLSSGAEIYRTEETMHYIAKGLGIQTLEAYVTNRGIFATAETEDGTRESCIMNVPETDVNIDKIESINKLSRRITQEKLSAEEVKQELRAIQHAQDFPITYKLLAYTLGAGAFSYAIGSSIVDSLAAAIIGLVLGVYMCTIQRVLTSTVLITIIGSILIALLANLSLYIGFGHNLSAILLGAMIDMVPGVPFVNAIREFSQNNYATGNTLMMSALLTCLSMAAGLATVQSIIFTGPMIPIYAGQIETPTLLSMLSRSILAGLGTVAFAILFHVRKEHFLDCCILGALTWATFLTLSTIQSNTLVAVFISGFIIVLASRFLAVKRKCPVTVFLMTSLFPLLPGLSFYRSVYYMLMGETTISINFAKESFLIAFTIAISIVVVQQFGRKPQLTTPCKNNDV